MTERERVAKMGSVVYKRDYQEKALKDPKIKAQEKKRLLMNEDERIKTALTHTYTIRLTIATIERLKMAASHGQAWNDVINNLLDVYYDAKEKKKRAK
jgi:hypothetical protein